MPVELVTACDVVIVGAGTAGCAAASILAPHCRVVLVDRQAQPRWRIGETLPGASARLLRQMKAWEEFASAGHPAAAVRTSRWGSDQPETLDSFRDPDGTGWRIDRARFEANLRETACRAGAQLMVGSPAGPIGRESDGWRWALRDGRTIVARLLIDASGRNSRLVRHLGQRQLLFDKLGCIYQVVAAPDDADDWSVYTQATATGWWYTAQIGTGRRLVAFHSDTDLPYLKSTLQNGVLNSACSIPGLVDVLGAAGEKALAKPKVCSAASIARSAAGPGWLAVGDAALAFDPLSSQGLFNALATGVEAGELLLSTVHDDAVPSMEIWRTHAARIGQIWNAYLGHLKLAYRLEQRWPDMPFWRRRLD